MCVEMYVLICALFKVLRSMLTDSILVILHKRMMSDHQNIMLLLEGRLFNKML